jgi:hypothetical protein
MEDRVLFHNISASLEVSIMQSDDCLKYNINKGQKGELGDEYMNECREEALISASSLTRFRRLVFLFLLLFWLRLVLRFRLWFWLRLVLRFGLRFDLRLLRTELARFPLIELSRLSLINMALLARLARTQLSWFMLLPFPDALVPYLAVSLQSLFCLAFAGLSYFSPSLILVPAILVPVAFAVPCAPIPVEFIVMNSVVRER